jgi:hydrogenase maturation protease
MSEDARSPRTAVVVGLGNPVISDDRVGLAVAAELERLLAADPIEGVAVRSATRGGFELIDLMSGYARAILVDALEAGTPGSQPGRVRRLGLDDLDGSLRVLNAHEMTAADAFRLAAHLDIPVPATVEIYAVETGDTTTLSEDMTAPVEAAVAPLARRLHTLLRDTAA